MKLTGHVARIGELKKSLVRLRRTREDNIKMDLTDVDWIYLAQDKEKWLL
jgi:hypothetical protein